MNGKYIVASGGNQHVNFNDDYQSKGHEYFDVYSPEIATHYGEVFWTDQGNNSLPKEIVERFKGNIIFFIVHNVCYNFHMRLCHGIITLFYVMFAEFGH
jgi:hypothetical protein